MSNPDPAALLSVVGGDAPVCVDGICEIPDAVVVPEEIAADTSVARPAGSAGGPSGDL